VGVVSAEVLGFSVMVTCLAMTVIGGSTRIAGAFLGALLLTWLPERLRFLEGQALLAYGAAMLAMVILAPEGLAGLSAKLPRILWNGGARSPTPLTLPSPTRDQHDEGSKTRVGEGRGKVRGEGLRIRSGTTRTLLEARGLARRFGGIEAIAGVDLTVAEGEILGLIGPNGSGKTTLANLVTGFVKPDRGTIAFRGRRIDGRRPFEIARLGIARTFQSPSLPAGITALDAVAVACASHGDALGIQAALAGRDRGVQQSRFEAEAMSLLERSGVGAAAMQSCDDLAAAVARRVEVAYALALEPRLLILDEPAAGLGESEQAELAHMLRTLAADGLGLILIEHNMPFLLGLADRVTVLDAGRVIAQGKPHDVRRDPTVIAAYLGGSAS
jgi:branched-chain amino acid transport system permease protein